MSREADMAFDWRTAWRALRSGGVPASSVYRAIWPLGREKRLRSLLRERATILSAKNAVVDYLACFQRALSPLRLTRTDQIKAALSDPEKRRLILSVAVSRAMVEEALVTRYGVEAGRTLDQALAELTREQVIAEILPNGVFAGQQVYLALHGRGRPAYDVATLNELLRRERDLGAELRTRLQREETADRGRSYRL
jgi:hypothetical protein